MRDADKRQECIFDPNQQPLRAKKKKRKKSVMRLGRKKKQCTSGGARTLTSAMVCRGPRESLRAQTRVRADGVRALGVHAAHGARLGALVHVHASFFRRSSSAGVTGRAHARVVAHRVDALRVRAARR